MKQLGRTSVYIIVSLLLHFTILLYIPDIDFSIKLKQKEIIDVQLIKVPPKIATTELSSTTNIDKNFVKNIKQQNKAASVSNIIKSQVDLPIVSVLEKIPLNEAQNQNNNIVIAGKNRLDQSVSKEITSSEAKLKQLKSEGTGEKQIVTTGKSDFFEITSNYKSERKIIHIPEKPTFSLESNTKIRLRFSIDAKGIPYSIILLTRSNPEIEKLAVKFVSGLRFESVPYKDVDTAEITVYFNVK
ncbi:MAG: hypothetical protein N3C60_05730 [Calditerrivibrio sp.]|nr:hypothetical protein [Calditerrivibrio sp.]